MAVHRRDERAARRRTGGARHAAKGAGRRPRRRDRGSGGGLRVRESQAAPRSAGAASSPPYLATHPYLVRLPYVATHPHLATHPHRATPPYQTRTWRGCGGWARRPSTALSLRTRAPASAPASRPRLRPSSASVRRLPMRYFVQQATRYVGNKACVAGQRGPPCGLAEAGRSFGQPGSCSGAERSLRSAS